MAKKKKSVGKAKAPAEKQQPDAPTDRANEEPKPAAVAAPPTKVVPDEPGLPVAGLVASAGGLDAFKRFFRAMPPDSGIAFVLIPHLDPVHESLMVELLSRYTSMTVVEAKNGIAVQANHVYVIPPNKFMTIEGGVLCLTGPVGRHASQTSIDLFLRSLAEDQKERSICIILSGTGSHGATGLRAVKAAGGMAMVQEPSTAEYEQMPRSAVATQMADYVLPAERMPATLLKYVHHPYLRDAGRSQADGDESDHLTGVLALLRARTKFDFRCYRKRMLTRRVERRMGLNHIGSIAEYLGRLRDDPEELQLLVKDLFINVTNFFRDPDAFALLESQVLAPLVRSKEESDGAIRIWCPGCATGEEPYSLAMLVAEQFATARKTCRVQIFATDVDKEALEVARQGIYPESIAADVTPERLGRFFSKTGDGSYRVNKSLRESVVFAVQDLINDAPFTKLDLISCRNLLIYLEPDIQKKALRLFHFALNEGGSLFLGSSESIGRQVDIFEPLSKKWRLYRRTGPARPQKIDFPILVSGEGGAARGRSADAAGVQLINFGDMTKGLLLEKFAPAAVLINRKYEILYYFGPCSQYLEFPTGDPTHDLTRMARDGVRAKLRGIVHQALQEKETAVSANVRVKRNGGYYPVRLTVSSILSPPAAEGLLLVTFEENLATSPADAPSNYDASIAPDDITLRQLEFELRATREDLQCTIEQLESSNEEMKASNEETMSMNEELQLTNEELETSKEELQSLNEELSTVNSQLQEKVEELEKANNDMANLLHCADIATVFLDVNFRIQLFTPAATKLFNLINMDVGRPIGDITRRFTDPEFLDDAQQVLERLAPREREVQTADGLWWSRRVMPYRTRDNRIDGVVVTFVDITERKLAADDIVRLLASVVESSADAIVSQDLDGRIRTWNRGAERLYGYTRTEAVGQPITLIVPEDRADEMESITHRLQSGESIEQWETERIRKDGQRVPVALTASPIRDDRGNVVSASVIARDISERQRTERELREREEYLQAILTTAADAIITIDLRGAIQAVNPATERMFGYTADEMVGQNVNMLMPSPYREAHDSYLERYARTGEKHIIGVGREVEGLRKDGSAFPVDLAISEIDHLKLYTGFLRDNTGRKELEKEVVEIASKEQQRIAQDLHDSVAQELTALNLMANDLVDTVLSDPDSASNLARRIVQGSQRSQQSLRDVLRGLLPVAVAREGLMSALADLADRTQQQGKMNCVFDCPRPVSLADHLTATHLYLIAQEAVHNALKHGHPRNIRIGLTANGLLVLQIQCDGVGMPKRLAESRGLGLRIMRNRAAIIGAKLTIEACQLSGALVTCVLARAIPEQEFHDE